MKSNFLITIFLFFSLLLGFTLILPKYQDLKGISKNIELERQELQNQREYFQNLNKISERLKNYEAELAKINSALPSSPSLPSLLNFLTNISSQTGLVLNTIGLNATTSSKEIEGLQETTLDIVVSGSYSSFKEFLSALEKSARFIQIENLSFSTTGEKPETQTNFKLKIKIYNIKWP